MEGADPKARVAWRTALAAIARLQHEKPPGHERKIMKLVEKLTVLYKLMGNP